MRSARWYVRRARDSDCMYIYTSLEEIPPRYINAALCIHTLFSYDLSASSVLPRSRFWAAVSERLYSSAREKSRRARRESGYRISRTDQLDRTGDDTKFGKDAQTHHSVQGPFRTVYLNNLK